MAQQLAFDWPVRVALGREDFFVSSANARAFAMVSEPDSWPEGKLAIVGPKGSGKTHLARVFAQNTGAVILQAAAFGADLAPPEGSHVVIEDMENLPREAEEAIFHLHNHLCGHRRGRGRLLLTSDRAPSRWPIALPDLASRMQATTVSEIDDPDDRLLGAVMMKLFQDRQISPAPALIAYLVSRIDRSFAAAARMVADLDAAALAQGREINVPLARALLDNPPASGG